MDQPRGALIDMLEFFSQGWVGTTVGIAGLTLAVFFYWRSQIAGVITIQSHDMSMIGDDTAVFTDGVEVRYRDTPVPRITSSTVWMWNAGRKTVEGSKIVPHDPLQLRFDGKILNVRIRKVTRDVLRFTAHASAKASRMVCLGFDFLDPGDGCVFEVLHAGSAKAPERTGTIIGLPKGLQYRPREGSLTSRWTKGTVLLLGLPISGGLLILTLRMVLHGILGVFGVSDLFDRPLLAAVLFGFLSFYPIVILWGLWGLWISPSSPSSLDL